MRVYRPPKPERKRGRRGKKGPQKTRLYAGNPVYPPLPSRVTMGEVRTIRRKPERGSSETARRGDVQEQFTPRAGKSKFASSRYPKSNPTYGPILKVQSDPHGDMGADRESGLPFEIAGRFRLPKVAKFLVG